MTLPSSSLLSFFPKGHYKPRSIQVEALNFIEESVRAGKHNIIVQANTGTGKSPMATAICEWLDNGYILTSSKMLQDQYLEEFAELRKVKGRANFTCLVNGEKCDAGKCQGKDKYKCLYGTTTYEQKQVAAKSARRGDLFWSSESPVKCAYWTGKVEGLNTKTVVHNYDYVLTETNYIGDFGPRKVMVLDEAHNIESKLMEFLSLDVTQKTIETINQYSEKPFSFIWTPEDMEDDKKYIMYVEEAKRVLSVVETILEPNKNIIVDPRDVKAFCKLENKLEVFIQEATDGDQWIVQEKRDKLDNVVSLTFKPVFVKKYAYKYLLHLGKINVFFSATILNAKKFAESIGLQDYVYKELPPVYTPESNRIYDLKLVNLSHDDNDTKEDIKALYRQVTEKIDLILDRHPCEKGIIHCNSYEIATYIKEFTKHKKRVFIPTSKKVKKAIEQHRAIRNKNKPTVLCSPALTEGVDCKYDLSRFQILVKVPYPNTKDPQIAKRLLTDTEFHKYRAAITMIQAIGRSVRAEDDWCVTYLIDSRFSWFCKENLKTTKLFRRHLVNRKALRATLTDDLQTKIKRKSEPKQFPPLHHKLEAVPT